VNKFLFSLIHISLTFILKLIVFDSQFCIKTSFLFLSNISAFDISKLIINLSSFQVLLNTTGDKNIVSFEPKNLGRLSFIINCFVVTIVS
jgi:hypothetical protein